jgi:AcrR family transcriptional regulator
MVKTEVTGWREARRHSARSSIVDAAWALAREEGLLGWSLRDLATRAGITTPTVYAYFDSKHAIYDAMFGQAATELDDLLAEPHETSTPRDHLLTHAHRFFTFCTDDPERYQLLFQRTIPGFTPSPESYAPSIRVLNRLAELLAANEVTETRHRDLWTALASGLVAQQIANDPGGDRWGSLVNESVDMLLDHCRPVRESRGSKSRPGRKGGASS